MSFESHWKYNDVLMTHSGWRVIYVLTRPPGGRILMTAENILRSRECFQDVKSLTHLIFVLISRADVPVPEMSDQKHSQK